MRLARGVPALLVMGTLYVLSDQPQEGLPKFGLAVSDLLLHGLAYALLGVTLVFALGNLAEPRCIVLLLSVVIAALYGAFDEWHQSMVPTREASAIDWLADLGGACGGCALLMLRFDRTGVCRHKNAVGQ